MQDKRITFSKTIVARVRKQKNQFKVSPSIMGKGTVALVIHSIWSHLGAHLCGVSSSFGLS